MPKTKGIFPDLFAIETSKSTYNGPKLFKILRTATVYLGSLGRSPLGSSLVN
jgi:hypothetical protein